ncbi:MAG: bifunctional diaminohydroxyphosphoribosylaminopyrimidine deaminase/5-amino-6-(5-phosphoribosylamino)uracil reductase RibD [Candidatus Margulisiibacteriota bacterium]
MNRVFALAEGQKGICKPHPVTAALVVRDGVVVGEGVHQRPGSDHAEVAALKQAGTQAQGATLYVNLEPCSHHGKTPPCTDRLIQSGLARVVYPILDPNPTVRKTPAKPLLEAAGIAVCEGIGFEKALVQNQIFFKNTALQKPFILLKAGISLDGKIALANHQSKYITSSKSQKKTHQLRAEYDAILIGAQTVLDDNPLLTIRHGTPTQHPHVIILDRDNRIQSTDFALFQSGNNRKVFVVSSTPRELPGVTTLVIGLDSAHHFIWDQLLDRLFEAGIGSVIIEGGQGIFTSAIESGIVDQCTFVIAPKMVVGKNAVSVFAGQDKTKLGDILTLEAVHHKVCGEDVWVSGYVRHPRGWITV